MELMNFYISAYGVFSKPANGNCRLDEVFDDRPDWEAAQPVARGTAGAHFISNFAAFLWTGLVYFAR